MTDPKQDAKDELWATIWSMADDAMIIISGGLFALIIIMQLMLLTR